MATFVLVHGGFHGPWCWQELEARLVNQGHHTVTPELPVDDPSAGLAAYVERVVHGLSSASVDSNPVVLVGHSLGCRVVALVAEKIKVSSLVLLCHVPTGFGPEAAEPASMASLLGTRMFLDSSGLLLLEPSDFRRVFYGRCSSEVADWAVSRLRPQSLRPLLEPWRLLHWPDVPIQVVLGTHDVITPLDGARDAARAELPLHPEPIVLESDHSPFLSMPGELAELLTSTT